MTDKRVVLIAGPTASGKSALALALAQRLGGVVINADSMQVYRDLRVLTARPSRADEARVPHLLYGFAAADDAYSAGRFAGDAAEAMREAAAVGCPAIITGGTGLYFKALLEPLAPIPLIPHEIRTRWRREAELRGASDLHAELAGRDPETAARLRPTDPQRIVRALEVLEATGRPLAEWQRMRGRPVLSEPDVAKFVVLPERTGLLERADARLQQMMRDGALDEVRALDRLAVPQGAPILGALGVAPLRSHLSGNMTLEAALERTRLDTRQYIKRQHTWLRRNMNAWTALIEQETETNIATVMSFINRG